MKMSTQIRFALSRASGFIQKERTRIGFVLVSVLLGVIGFEVGLIRGSMGSSAPLVIEKPVGASVVAECPAAAVAGAATEHDGTVLSTDSATVPGSPGCRFIGSRNSDLYHRPGCGAAKRIKPENIVCFADEEAATARGYRAGCVK